MKEKNDINITTKQFLSKKRKVHQTPWLSPESIAIADERREVKNIGGTRSEVNQLNAKFQRQSRKDKEQYFSDMCKALEEDNKRGKTRDLFKKVKQITGKCSARLDGVRDKAGTLLTEDDDIKNRWREYTEEL